MNGCMSVGRRCGGRLSIRASRRRPSRATHHQPHAEGRARHNKRRCRVVRESIKCGTFGRRGCSWQLPTVHKYRMRTRTVRAPRKVRLGSTSSAAVNRLWPLRERIDRRVDIHTLPRVPSKAPVCLQRGKHTTATMSVDLMQSRSATCPQPYATVGEGSPRSAKSRT